MSGDDFLEELKHDFINEALFLMEQYEESMLALESAQDAQEHIGRIFRVAHSIKGGAAAVGFEDLSHFAHKAEDLLSILRVYPERITTELITLFLAVGDQFKARLQQLKVQDSAQWDVAGLTTQLKSWIDLFQKISDGHDTSATLIESTDSAVQLVQESKDPEPFMLDPVPSPQEDVTNYELLAELQAQLAPSLAQNIKAEQPGITDSQPVAEKPTSNVSSIEQKATGTKKTAQENAILKVDSLRVDAVLDAVGEIVVLKNQLIHSDAVRSGVDQRLNFIVDQLDKSIRDLYEKTLGIRMTPLRSLFMKLQRTVRDVSVKLHKPVDLELRGEETEVDRSVFELLGDPLMHMARNAMDHGIESKEKRLEAKKPEVAKLVISAKQTGGSVLIEIAEDGGGIDPQKILKKALEKNLVPEGVDPKTLTNEQIYDFLFAPGFSTAEVVTDLSGRGVGLDVVRSNIEKIKGSIRVQSELGKGTSFQISIPLTTAITDGIVVAIMGHNYMIPIHSIREIVQFSDKEVTEVANLGRVLNIRDRVTPILDLEKSLKLVTDFKMNMPSDSPQEARLGSNRKQSFKDPEVAPKTYIVLESGLGPAALLVDEVVGQSQVVAKPLQIGQSLPEFSGAATLGDGRTILILEPSALVQSSFTEVNTKSLKAIA